MKDINQKELHEGINILIWGFVIYILLIVLTKFIFARVKGDKQDVFRVLTIFGSTTFFGVPILKQFTVQLELCTHQYLTYI